MGMGNVGERNESREVDLGTVDDIKRRFGYVEFLQDIHCVTCRYFQSGTGYCEVLKVLVSGPAGCCNAWENEGARDWTKPDFGTKSGRGIVKKDTWWKERGHKVLGRGSRDNEMKTEMRDPAVGRYNPDQPPRHGSQQSAGAPGTEKQGNVQALIESWDEWAGGFTGCVDALEGQAGVDDPEGLCAWLHLQAEGKWPGEKTGKDGVVGFEPHEVVVVSASAMEELCPECAEMMRASGQATMELKMPTAKDLDRVADITGVAAKRGKAKKDEDGLAQQHAVQSGAGVLSLSHGDRIEVKLEKDVGKWNIPLAITKAYEEGGKHYIEGVASDDRVDKDNERMSPNAIQEMAQQAGHGDVPLLPTHKSEWDEQIGHMVKAEVTPQNELYVKAELDVTHPKAVRLMEVLKAGKQLGMSIGGAIQKAFHEFNQEAKELIKVIDSVRLDHIAVTGRPANPRAWISPLVKSVEWDTEAVKGQLKKEGRAMDSKETRHVEGGRQTTFAPMPTSPEDIYRKEADHVAPYEDMRDAHVEMKEAEAAKKDAEAEAARKDAYSSKMKYMEAAKAARIKAGMKEAEAEAEAMKEAEAAYKIAEAEAEAAMAHPGEGDESYGGYKGGKKYSSEKVTLTVTKAQAEDIRRMLARQELKTNPVYKALKDELDALKAKLERVEKSGPGRKGFGPESLSPLSKEAQAGEDAYRDLKETPEWKAAVLKDDRTEQANLLGKAMTAKLAEALK